MIQQILDDLKPCVIVAHIVVLALLLTALLRTWENEDAILTRLYHCEDRANYADTRIVELEARILRGDSMWTHNPDRAAEINKNNRR